MRLTVLGSAASHAGAAQACASHLVEGGATRILLDCGNGALANLYRVADPHSLDGVFITHNHPDHYADIYSLQAMIRYSPEGTAAPVPVFMDAPLYERMQLLLSERGAREFREAFPLTPLKDGVSVTVGDITVTPHQVDHTEPTFGLVVEADGARLAYTADTLPGHRADCLARGADMLLAEATLPDGYVGGSPHLSARTAGELARGAGVGALVLVHVWPTNDRAAMATQAALAFGGPAVVAREFDSFEVIPVEVAR